MQCLKLKCLAVAAVAALGLAACGGGTFTTTTMPEEQSPDAPATADGQRAAISEAVMTARTAVEAVDSDATADRAIAAAAAIAAARDAIAAATGVPAEERAGNARHVDVLATWLAVVTASRQRVAIGEATVAAMTAVAAVDNDSTAEEADAAAAAIAAARDAIAAATGVPAEERAESARHVDVLAGRLAAAVERRMEAERAAAAAIAATAAKLFAGIAPQNGNIGPSRRHAAHADGEDDRIVVLFGADPPDGMTARLVPDEETPVPENHGWQGRRYASSSSAGVPPGDGFEAVVYSNVEGLGRKFGSAMPGTGASRAFEYMLADGALALVTGGSAEPAFSASRVGSQRFVNIVDVKRFRLRGDETSVLIAGSYYGVSGTYGCTPGAGGACAVRVAAAGFELGTAAAGNAFTNNGGTWTFRPDDPNARVVHAVDSAYASYGWWLHTAVRNGQRFGALNASAFEDEKGGVPAAGGIDTLYGTATYAGGATGQYALSSLTGGINDAGSFVARATLEADFTGNTVSGTIDGFTGADGMERDWSVALADQSVSAGGVISGDGTPGSTARQMTRWTLGGKALAASGGWTGTFRDNGDDGVPKVVTGTFHAEFGHEGRMVGGFGANRQRQRRRK